MAARHDVGLPERQWLGTGDAQLLLHQVDAGDHFRDRVLDLDARVHLEEIEMLRVLVDDELDRAGTSITDAARERNGDLADLPAYFPQVGRRIWTQLGTRVERAY